MLGANAYYIAASGSATKMKLVSNLVLGLNRAALAEALVFAQGIDVDPASALEVLRGSMAYSRVMDIKGQKMLDEDFTVQARHSRAGTNRPRPRFRLLVYGWRQRTRPGKHRHAGLQ